VRNQKIKELTEINFSFIKTPISKPPFETVRNAGKALGIGKRSKPEIVIEKDSDEPAVPFNGNCDEVTQSKVVEFFSLLPLEAKFQAQVFSTVVQERET
jgi:hypothetical protein